MKIRLPVLLLCFFLLSLKPVDRSVEVLPFEGETAAQLNALIAAAPDNAIIQLAPRLYVFDQPIIVSRSHLTIRGSGRGKTRLRFRLPKSEPDDFIQISGGRKLHVGKLVRDAARAAHTIELAGDHGLAAGDLIYLSRPNSADLLQRFDWGHLSPSPSPRAWRTRPLRENLTEVTGGVAGTVHLAHGLAFDFPAQGTDVYRIDPVRHVRLSDLTVMSDHGRPQPRHFANTLAGVSGTAALRLRRSVDISLQRLEILDAPSKGIALDSSLAARLNDLRIDGSHNKGPGGDGYGIELRETFHSELRGLAILNTRHAVVFSSWHMEAGNRVHVAHTNRDINFHGGLDHSNQVIVDSMVLDYAMDQRNGRPKHAWSAISKGGRQHPNTNFYASNVIAMGQIVSSWRNDVLIADHRGSQLDAQGGHDVIIGGRRADVVRGGTGTDRFLLGPGGDRIADFQPGPGGDELWLPFEFEHLPKYARAGDNGLLISWGSGASVYLAGVQMAQLSRHNIRTCRAHCRRLILAQHRQP